MNIGGRACTAPADVGIMAARTLANSYPALIRFLERNTSVLDVGCGPGTLTMEMARRVDPGVVVGMDANPEMIRAAEEASPPGAIPNLVFYTGDIRESGWDGEFELVNCCRTLEWVPDLEVAIDRMARATAPGGHVVLIDFDHTKAEWSDPPEAWTRFYHAFLDWRTAGGLDNALAHRLPGLCAAAGLADVEVTPKITTVRAGEPDFFRVAGRWRMLIESRGRQMVLAGRLAETERRNAFEAFTEWMMAPGATETVHETCVAARHP